MEENHHDAIILYEEFHKMGVSLVKTMHFVRKMVEDWPMWPELQVRTALRMQQVRHRMPELLEMPQFEGILNEASPAALGEYLQWIQVERAEGLEINLVKEIILHTRLLPLLLLAKFWQILQTLAVGAAIASVFLLRHRVGGKDKAS